MRVVLVLGASTLAYGVGGVFTRADRALAHVWADAGWTLISLLSALKAFHTARHSPNAVQKRAFRWFGASFFSWFVGMLIWDGYELHGIYTPAPSWAAAPRPISPPG